MRQRAHIHYSLCLVVATALGCGSGSPGNDASNPKDAHDGGDTNNADTTQLDGSPVDMVVDAPVDMPADVGVETGVEAGAEAQPETGAEGGTEVHADAGSESGIEAPSDAGADAVGDTTQADVGVEAGPPDAAPETVAMCGRILCNCTLHGIPLYGKVKFVTAFPDFKIRETSFPDLKVKTVTAFADSCGKWQEVTAFEDFSVQVVTAFEDFQIQYSDFPGVP
jgi:hypothetical protein